MKTILMIIALTSVPGHALTLAEYLNQVRNENPQAKSLAQQADSIKLRMEEADSILIPELYGLVEQFDDKRDQISNFAQSRAQGHRWQLGLRKQTSFGLQGNVYFLTQRNTLTNAPAFAFSSTDYQDSTAVFELRQSLWRNGFGDATRADIEARRSELRAEELRARFELKNLLLNAEDLYWALVSYNQIVKLQEENVERAMKLRDLMRRKSGLRLVDDVDALQAQAAFESRELELKTSRDERAALIRQFNTMRGRDSDEIEKLDEFPAEEMVMKVASKPGMTREDFKILMEQARVMDMKSRSARSTIQPKLDLVATYGSNGMDGRTANSYSEAHEFRHPYWTVGLQFAVSIDIGTINDIRRGYAANRRAARELAHHAQFSLERVYADLHRKLHDAQDQYERARKLERLQTELVQKERRRLINGRTTTFQALTLEQNLAAAQIQRVRAQLALVQARNQLKSFEEQQ